MRSLMQALKLWPFVGLRVMPDSHFHWYAHLAPYRAGRLLSNQALSLSNVERADLELIGCGQGVRRPTWTH